MKRSDAIQMFGRHFYTGEGGIAERLGPARSDNNGYDLQFDRSEDAYDTFDARAREKAQRELGEVSRILSKLSTKILVFRAQRGWHPRAESILKQYAEYRVREKRAVEIIDNGVREEHAIQFLTSDIRMPVMLETGQTIYRIKSAFLEDGLQLQDLKITERRLAHCYFKRGDGYDYTFHYTARNEQGAELSFQYEHDNTDEPEIKTNSTGNYYFLTREATDDQALALIDRMTANFNIVAGQIRQRQAAARDSAPGRMPPDPALE